jgi:hypothetical protein
LQFARSDLLPGLHRAWESISRAKVELAARKAKLSGKLDASRQGLSLGALKERHRAEIDQVDELEEAIAAAESAVVAAREEVRLEAGVLNERDFNELPPSTEQRPAAPWLRRRKDATGMEEVRVVDLEQRVERLATPEEIERGVFYESYEEYQEGKVA